MGPDQAEQRFLFRNNLESSAPCALTCVSIVCTVLSTFVFGNAQVGTLPREKSNRPDDLCLCFLASFWASLTDATGSHFVCCSPKARLQQRRRKAAILEL